jgi:hypothetical protein
MSDALKELVDSNRRPNSGLESIIDSLSPAEAQAVLKLLAISFPQVLEDDLNKVVRLRDSK